MAKPKPPIADDAGAGLKHNPFAALSGRSAPIAEPSAASATTAQAHASDPPAREQKAKSLGRVVLRRETKHRGGKAVIIVTGLDKLRGYDSAAIAALAKQLKQSLGCGGTVEEHNGASEIVLQGDKPAKVAELLRAQGFRVDGVTG